MRRARHQVDFDRCRALGHRWDDVDADRAPAFGYYMWFRCYQCDTTRKDIVDRFGQLLSRSYEYLDEYHDTENYTRSDYRIRLLSRRIDIGAPPPGAGEGWLDVKPTVENNSVPIRSASSLRGGARLYSAS